MSFRLRSYRGDAASHRHGFHQLVLPRAGTLDIEIDGRGGRVEHGRAAFVGTGERHTFEARGANTFVVVDLASDAVGSRDEALLQRRFVDLGARAHLLLAGLGEHMPMRLEAQTAWSRLLLDALHGETRIEGVDAAWSLLDAELERRCDSTWLARLAGLSRAQFYRRFVARHGVSPAAFQRGRRLQHALDRLRGSDATIARVAGEAGYSEHSALTRALRKVHGKSPRALRRE